MTDIAVNDNAIGARRGSKDSGLRRVHWDLEEVAVQVACAGVDCERGEEEKLVGHLDLDLSEESSSTEPCKEAAPPAANIQAALRKLPTPSRGGRSAPQALELAGRVACPTAPPVAVPACLPAIPSSGGSTPVSGMEPWCLMAAAGATSPTATVQTPMANQQGSYRERLQARGQHAMQRSTGGAGGRPQRGGFHPPVPPPVAAPRGSPMAGLATSAAPPPPLAPPGAGSQTQAVQTSGAASILAGLLGPAATAWPTTPADAAARAPQQWFGAGSELQHATMPSYQQAMAGQQSPSAFSSCVTPVAGQTSSLGFGSLTPMSQGQLSPAAFDNFQQQTPTVGCEDAGNAPLTPQDMMAMMMPGAGCLDKEQIAQHLRAAAENTGCYDD